MTESITADNIINAMAEFDMGIRPDHSGEPTKWYVVHPETGILYPPKSIWSLSSGQANNQFDAGVARRKLEIFGFKCVLKKRDSGHSRFMKSVEKSARQSESERLERLASAPITPRLRFVESVQFVRNVDVIIQRLFLANGHCDNCTKKAPFLRKSNNSPYLEVHHIITLADGGDDTVANTLALCPNCHRHAHHG